MRALGTIRRSDTIALWSAGWLPPVFYFLIGILVFHPALKLPFITDDYTYLITFYSKSFSSLFGAAHGFQFFRPLADALFIADSFIWHYNPWGFHLTNLLIHIANSYLVFLLATRWFSAFSSHIQSQLVVWLSFSAGLLFLILPSHIEAVVWISGRYDLIAAFFMLLAMLAASSFLATHAVSSGILTAFFCAASFLSKESAITLPVILAGSALAWWCFQRPHIIKKIRSVFGPAIIAFSLLSIYITFRFLCIHQWIGGYGSEVHFNPSIRLILSHLLIAPIKAVLFPFPLHLSTYPDYGIWILLFLVSALAVGIMVVITRSLKRSVLPFIALALLFYIAYLPAATLHLDLFGTYGERFLYFPSVFLVIGLVHFISIAISHKSAIILTIAALSLGYIGASGRSLRFWNQASAQAASILDEAVTLAKSGPLVVLNLPDNYCGAYIWQLGFPEALAVKKLQLLEEIIKKTSAAEQKKLLSAMNSASTPDTALVSVREKLADLAQTAGVIPSELEQQVRQLQFIPSLNQVHVLTTHPVDLLHDLIRVEKIRSGKFLLTLYGKTINLEYDAADNKNPLFFSEGHLHRY